jgi:hypothetical protein
MSRLGDMGLYLQPKGRNGSSGGLSEPMAGVCDAASMSASVQHKVVGVPQARQRTG